MSNTKLEHFISRVVPSVIIEDRPQFALFIEKYFEHIGRELGEFDSATNLLKYLNIDSTIPEFYDDFKSTYAPLLPDKYKASLSIIVKNILTFYQTKGTEASFTTFFRMIFDVAIDIYYPKVDMLRCSDGRWVEPYYLYPSDQDYGNQYYYYDKLIRGTISNSIAYVQSIIQIDDPGVGTGKVSVLSLVDRTGVFINGESIVIDGESSPTLPLDGTNAVVSGEGFWRDTEGFLSWNKYIQDSDYYQEYSYEIISPIDTTVFERSAKTNLHPAGLKSFALVSEGITLIDIGLSEYLTNIVEWISQDNVEHIINSNKYKVSNSNLTTIDIEDYYFNEHWNIESTSLIDIELTGNIENVVDWIRNDNVEHIINSNKYKVDNSVSAPALSSGNDFDWRYFEQNRDSTAFRQLYPISALGSLTIGHISNNYAENFLTVTIDGTATTAYSILNEVITLDTPLVVAAGSVTVSVTTNDLSIPINNRIYLFSGRDTQDTFVLPVKINRMDIGATLAHVITTA